MKKGLRREEGGENMRPRSLRKNNNDNNNRNVINPICLLIKFVAMSMTLRHTRDFRNSFRPHRERKMRV